LKKLRISFMLLLGAIISGVLGFHFIEGMPYFDALYMTVITISTVGFQEVRPLSVPGRAFTMLLISTGIMLGAYTIGTFVRMLIEGELSKTFGRKKVKKKISKLINHFIICGYGRIGSLVCKELMVHKMNFVVIENNPSAIERLESAKVLYLPNDATAEETLVEAGIMRARGIVTAVGSDSDNVFITLTAKGLKPDIFVLARASDEKDEIKLKRAGATRVVSPYLIGGKRMAQVLVKPTVVDFIDIAVMESDFGLQMEEFMIKQGSRLVGKNLIESNLRKDFGIIIVLIKKHAGKLIFNPQPSEVLEADDTLVVLGKIEDMKRMNEKV
jgi:voltage-gated potassium channel